MLFPGLNFKTLPSGTKLASQSQPSPPQGPLDNEGACLFLSVGGRLLQFASFLVTDIPDLCVQLLVSKIELKTLLPLTLSFFQIKQKISKNSLIC